MTADGRQAIPTAPEGASEEDWTAHVEPFVVAITAYVTSSDTVRIVVKQSVGPEQATPSAL
jgi:hypothetical protein